VSELGLGLAALGRPAYINIGHGRDVPDRSVEGMERAAHAVLDGAYAGGVRSFDAARSYGLAEAFLASWLERRGRDRDDVFVSSKWGYSYTGGWRVDADQHEVKELTAAQLRRQWRETSELLGDHIRLYQIHSATVDSGVLDDPEVRAELAALRATGVLIGLTVTGPEQSATIDRALEAGGFDAVQATWNLRERSAAGALERAHTAGLRVYVKEALANGRLAEHDQPALAAALAQPWADVVLSGAATVAQLESNLRARALDWTPELERRFAELQEDPETYWRTRSELPWN
jgi:aryl-alcohol dehydrogenase-like predicted oxidoreductase